MWPLRVLRTQDEPPTLFVINHETRRFATTRPRKVDPPPPEPRARLRVCASCHGVQCRVWAETPPPKTVADLKFEELFFRGIACKEELVPDSSRFRPLKDWLGAQMSERVDGVPTQLYEASTRLRSTHVMKTNHYKLSASFEQPLLVSRH